MNRPADALVREERGGDVLRLVLDRPPLNVLDVPMLGELETALERAAGSDAKVVLLAGAGRAFCAGVDVADHLPGRVEQTLPLFHRVLMRLWELDLPVVAAVKGAALGGGCELLLSCDVVLAREDARIGQPEIRLASLPPAAAVLLPRLIGRQRALDLILTGRSVGAQEAERLGLVARVFPEEAFDAEVDAFLRGLTSLSRPVLRLAKQAVREGLRGEPDRALGRIETLYLERLVPLEDATEGLRAFLDKREPAWREG